MGKECKNCGATNPIIEEYCLSCGEKLESINKASGIQEDVEGSSVAAILAIFLIIFGVIIFAANIISFIMIDGYDFWDFILGIVAWFFYCAVFLALIEVVNNAALSKGYAKKNYDYLKALTKKQEEES